MQNFSNFKWVFPWSFIVHVFGSILRFFLRFFSENFVEKGSILDDFCDNGEMDCDQIEEKEVETVYYTSNTSKYLSSTGNSVCAFIEEPQNMQFRVQEIFMISPNNSSPKKDDTSFEVISGQCSVDFDNHSFNHDLRVDFCSLDYNDCHELSEEMGVKQDEMIDQKDEIIEKKEFCDEVHSCISNSDDFWAIIHEYDCFLDKNDELDSCFDEILDEKVNYDQDNPMMIEDSRNNVEENLTKDEILNNGEEDSRNNVEENLTKDEISNNDEEDDQIKTSDIIMAQRELIRQMKKEIRQLKVCGLPTILEELESPIMEEDLKPLKIDKRMGHKDRMQEIHTFYRMYLDKMKKLDILTHQTIYAIEVLKLKYQKMSSNKKVKIPVMKSFVAQNLWFNKLRKHESEPAERLITDLERELELAYVGQLCLSWEMLKWQHYKAEELHVHDPDGFYQHNQVSGEFQKFQVLLQRFTEDEPFQHASRVPHYVNTRSHLPAFLQVPLIKDDPRSERGKNGEDGISIKMLKEVIASSMCTYSEFVHADKIEVSTFLLMRIQGLDQVALQHPSDAELLTQIRSTLQKKEKRLKDLVRAGNCLVRKFQKQEDQKLSHEMMVAQVELRLVARVLSMPKLSTDQLLWCHKRLNKIHIIDRKIYIDYSFLPFPC